MVNGTYALFLITFGAEIKAEGGEPRGGFIQSNLQKRFRCAKFSTLLKRSNWYALCMKVVLFRGPKLFRTQEKRTAPVKRYQKNLGVNLRDGLQS